MKTIIICIICILPIVCFANQSQQAMLAQYKLVNANNDFGFRLFTELIKQDDIKNTFISPTSIAMALAMTYNGADRTTKDSMAKTLAVTELSLKEFNQANLDFRKSLTKKNKKITLTIANSLWADKGTQFRKDFLSTNKQFYSAKIATLNFAESASVKIINQWVNDATKSKIEKIMDEIGGDVIAFLINAIYFKGSWQTEFDNAFTLPRTFYCLDNSEKKHPMMYQDNRFPYLRNDKFQAVSLPYANGNMSMYIFLPNKDSDIKAFLSQLNLKNWQEWMSVFTLTDGDITLPRFKLEYEKSLKDVLKAIGMEIAFDDTKANFTKMASSEIKGNIYIGDVKHKTFVEVNEEGTEAAAVTSVQMEIKGAPASKFSLLFNRPFFYVIIDNQTNAILFMGILTEPK